MAIIISQPVAITASQQTTFLIADHFSDQIVGLNRACVGRFESQSIKEPETKCISGTNMVVDTRFKLSSKEAVHLANTAF